MLNKKSKKLLLIAVFLVLFTIIPISPVLAKKDFYIDVWFKDGVGDPITTALDVRVSLWDIYDVRDEDIDVSGNINTSARHYGGYQTTFTVTPDGNGYFTPVTYGYYLLKTKDLADFPHANLNSYYLQLEYKAQGAPNTDYQIYDFVNDPPYQNISRYKLMREVAYLASDAGPRTAYNTFTLDANDSSTSEIKLEFGEILAKSLTYNITNDRFELNDGLKITGDAGQQKLAVAANASDPADQAQFEVRTSGNVLVFSVDQDGEVDVDRGGTLRNFIAGTSSATDSYRPLLDAGLDSDGTVTFNATFAVTPYIFLTIYNTSTANIVPSAWVTSKSTTGFTYKATYTNGSSVTDMTSSTDVHWLAVGVE